jgi:hypothetical protein
MSPRSVLAPALAFAAAGALAAPIALSSVAPDPGARKLQDRLSIGVVMPLPASPPAAPLPAADRERGASGKADRGVFREARLHRDAVNRAVHRTVTIENRTGPNLSELIRVPISDVPVR